MIGYLALDVGSKFIGTARSDGLGICATPGETLKRENGIAEKIILDLIQQDKVGALVVGMPYNEDGSLNDQCRKVQAFVRRLVRRCKVEVFYQDEYLSTHEAKELRSSKEIDSLAAALILQSFLNMRNQKGC